LTKANTNPTPTRTKGTDTKNILTEEKYFQISLGYCAPSLKKMWASAVVVYDDTSVIAVLNKQTLV